MTPARWFVASVLASIVLAAAWVAFIVGWRCPDA
jgi:hypothetical protein